MSKPSDSVARWREILRNQVRSGLSLAAHCRRVGVPLSSLCFWRRKLRHGAGGFAEVGVIAGNPPKKLKLRRTRQAPAPTYTLDEADRIIAASEEYADLFECWLSPACGSARPAG